VCDSSFAGNIFLNTTGGTAPITYKWSNGSTDKDIVYLNPGQYIVTVKDGNACERRDTFVIASLSPLPPTIQTAGGSTVLCSGDSLTLTASLGPVGTAYQWFNAEVIIPGATAQQLIVGAAGSYTVQLTTDSLCNSLPSNPLAITQEFGIEPTVFLHGDTLTANATATAYQWLFNNQPIPGATGYEHVATQSGVYEMEITSANGCTFQSSGISIVISSTALPTNVSRFSLAPNPASDQAVLTMELQRGENTVISMTDGQGRTLFSQSHQEQKIVVPIDLRGLPAGTYFLHVQTEKGVFVRTLVRR